MADSGTQTAQLLSQSVGYGILVGVGACFAIMIVIATRLLKKYLHENSQSTEMFMVANRTVGVGLTASAVYSSWTWATELLWCVTMVYYYGVQSAYWYGAGLAVHICLMAVLGIEAKKKIPTGHTCLEIVELRYGKEGHILYMFLCLVNNLLLCSSMILGTAGAISIACDNLHIVASTMLIPFGVLLYTAVGGLKSTFLTDYVHSFILLIVLCYICTASLNSEHIGGIDNLYNMVRDKELSGQLAPIPGNYQGSYLTGKSQGAIFFGIIHAVGDFGLTVMDSSFWQKLFSAEVKATVPGYLLAAFTIFANVWPLGTIVGLANVALESNPIFPTYPRKMTDYEINSGFGLMYTVKALLGKNALAALVLVLYLAVTSTVSAQMISVSSIISFDIYRKYFKPDANNKQLIFVSHAGVVFFGLFSAGFLVMLHYVGVDMTWLAYFYSLLICPGVIPMVLMITWSGQTKLAFLISPVVGIFAGLAVWIGTAYLFYGEVTISSLGQQFPSMYGGLTTLFLPGILTVAISLVKPSKFDWSKLAKESQLIDDKTETNSDSSENASEEISQKQDNDVLQSDEDQESSRSDKKEEVHLRIEELADKKTVVYTLKEKRLISVYTKVAYGAAIFVLLLTWVVWPLPLYRDWIWSKAYFRGWTVMGLFWVYMALLVIGVFPLYDGRHALWKVITGIFGKIEART